MVKAQFDRAEYSDIAFAIPTRIDASGTYYLIEDMNNENITTEVVGSLNEGKWANMHEQSRRVYGTEGVAPTIHTCGGGNHEPKIMHDAGVCVEDDDYSDLFKRELYKGVNINIKFPRRYRIRKLTERECFRLMGVDDADIDKIQAANISKTQQYKMAGNSIVVDVLYHIFRKMFVETKADVGVQLEMF